MLFTPNLIQSEMSPLSTLNLDEIESFLKGMDSASDEKRLRIVRSMGMYSVGLFAVTHSEAGDVLNLAGSGTLVQIDGFHYILTARHVWDKVLINSDQMGVTLRPDFDHSHLVDVSALVPFGPNPNIRWSEFGPDIVLLRIPDVFAGTIKAFKVFYNLSIDEPEHPTMNHLETWFVMGMLGCTGTYTQKHASVEHWGAEVGMKAMHMDGSFDFCDVNVNVSFLPPPKSIGGVSGGGLWKIYLHGAPNADGFESVEVLAGVAFWEFELNGNERIVRCHGPESIKSIVKSFLETNGH